MGNGLACANCHLVQGRKANSAPLWAAYTMYPAYRKKNDKVNSYAERLQGCFQFSMNGKAPEADGLVIAALSAYSYWLATGAPTGQELPGRDKYHANDGVNLYGTTVNGRMLGEGGLTSN